MSRYVASGEYSIAAVKNEIAEFTAQALQRRVKRYDSQTGEVLEYGDSYEDLADYFPAVFTYGDRHLLKSEVDRTCAAIGWGDSVYLKPAAGVQLGLSRAYDQSDLIFGLLLAAMMDSSYLAVVKRGLSTWKQYFFDPPAMAVVSRIPGTAIRLPRCMMPRVPVLSAVDHGIFVELFALYAQLSGDEEGQSVAWEILQAFTSTPAFLQWRIFPFYQGAGAVGRMIVSHFERFARRDGEFQLLKENSSLMFGILRLHRIARDKERRQGARQLLCDILESWSKWGFSESHGVFMTNYNQLTRIGAADLTCFHAIDVLIAASQQLDECKFLLMAERIAQAFIDLQNRRTGLIPFVHPAYPVCARGMRILPGVSWLDGTVDFGVALCRLFAATGKQEYLDAALSLASGVWRYHHLAHGWASAVRVIDGGVVNSQYSLKMTALVIKLFLAIEDPAVTLSQDTFSGLLLQDR